MDRKHNKQGAHVIFAKENVVMLLSESSTRLVTIYTVCDNFAMLNVLSIG